MSNYFSLTDTCYEAGLSGPRWKLRLIKTLQHTAPAFGLLCVTGFQHALAIALVCGPIAYALVLMRKLATRPKGTAAASFGVFVAVHLSDWCFDASFALLPVFGVLVATRQVQAAGIAGGLVAGLLVAFWREGEP